jgi:hypothetical protein
LTIKYFGRPASPAKSGRLDGLDDGARLAARDGAGQPGVRAAPDGIGDVVGVHEPAARRQLAALVREKISDARVGLVTVHRRSVEEGG